MKNQIQIVAALAVCGLVPGCSNLDKTIAAAPEPAPAYNIEYPPALQELNFQSDGKRLNGLMYVADGPGPHPTVVLLHGFPGNEKNLDLAQALRTDGFNVLFFHYRGAWGSEGDFSFTHVIEDVAAATDFLRANAATYRTDPDRLILIGHSMGGFAALEAGAKDETIACTAGIAPADFAVLADAAATNPELKAGFAAFSDTLQMLAGTSGEALISEIMDNRDAFDVKALAPAFAGRSVLLVGADKDASVSPETMMEPLIAAFEADPDVKTTGIMLSGDHSFSWSRDDLIDVVTDWAEGCR